MAFVEGQIVVCVDATGKQRITEGKQYRVIGAYSRGRDFVTVMGDTGGDYDYFASRFAAIETPAARSNDPATSKGKRKVNKYEEAVLAALGKDSMFGSDQRAYTGKEIAQLSGNPLNCITPRFAPLRRKGLIKDSGQRRDKQIVWVLGDGREVTCKVTAHKEEYRSRTE